MIDSNAYNYIDVLTKAADASWLRDQAIANNLANIDTPGYKRQDVDFEGVLERELRKSQYKSLDKKVDDLKLSRLDVGTYTDLENYSYRIDKNNVDVDTENVMLAENQIKYQGLVDGVSQEFNRLKMVMK